MTNTHGSELEGLGQDFKNVRKQILGGVKRLEAKKAAREFQEMEEDQKVLSYTIHKKFQETDMDAYEALMANEYKKEAEE